MRRMERVRMTTINGIKKTKKNTMFRLHQNLSYYRCCEEENRIRREFRWRKCLITLGLIINYFYEEWIGHGRWKINYYETRKWKEKEEEEKYILPPLVEFFKREKILQFIISLSSDRVQIWYTNSIKLSYNNS